MKKTRDFNFQSSLTPLNRVIYEISDSQGTKARDSFLNSEHFLYFFKIYRPKNLCFEFYLQFIYCFQYLIKQ